MKDKKEDSKNTGEQDTEKPDPKLLADHVTVTIDKPIPSAKDTISIELVKSGSSKKKLWDEKLSGFDTAQVKDLSDDLEKLDLGHEKFLEKSLGIEIKISGSHAEFVEIKSSKSVSDNTYIVAKLIKWLEKKIKTIEAIIAPILEEENSKAKIKDIKEVINKWSGKLKDKIKEERNQQDETTYQGYPEAIKKINNPYQP